MRIKSISLNQPDIIDGQLLGSWHLKLQGTAGTYLGVNEGSVQLSSLKFSHYVTRRQITLGLGVWKRTQGKTYSSHLDIGFSIYSKFSLTRCIT